MKSAKVHKLRYLIALLVLSAAALFAGVFASWKMDPLPKASSEYTSEEEVIQDIMKMTENLIRMAPEQYLWLYKRFQYIPQDASEELKRKYPSYARVVKPSFFSRVRGSGNKSAGE